MDGSPVRLAELLRRHGLHLKKGLGQNFLADPVHLDRIVAAAELTPDDVVVEVGPGVGTLTARQPAAGIARDPRGLRQRDGRPGRHPAARPRTIVNGQ